MAHAPRGSEGGPALDTTLLEGVAFRCRDDCGLCCFAEPVVGRAEVVRLVRIAPEAEIVSDGRSRFLAARPEGGACQFLRDLRCRVHSARPAPCREFPITVHLGLRLQATAVLSCPGLDLDFLSGASSSRTRPARGLEGEIASVNARIDGAATPRLEAAARRYRRIVRALREQGRWTEEAAVREELGRALPFPGSDDFPAPDPPTVEEGLESLPLFFDGRSGPVGIASGLGGWELLQLREAGGVERVLDSIPPARSPPALTTEGHAVLAGYLRHWLARDALFGSVLPEMLRAADGTVSEWIEAELRGIGALTLARADLRSRARSGARRPLTADDLREGIRATDQDLLDRPTWGERF